MRERSRERTVGQVSRSLPYHARKLPVRSTFRSTCGGQRRIAVGSLLLLATFTLPASVAQDARLADAFAAVADWGGDHVGQEIPPYVTGDECLFCHRKIGPIWGDNRHQRTVRAVTADDPVLEAMRSRGDGQLASLAGEVEFVLGAGQVARPLRKSSKYGRLDLLNVVLRKPANDAPYAIATLARQESPVTWDADGFADRCAGCHATAVDPQTRAFSARSLDCYVCHGDVPLEHTQDVKRVFLSSQQREPRQVNAICSQCHLRGGTAKSTRAPYANSFVPGDNLFRDFTVDFSATRLAALSATEQHVFRNARDAARGATKLTCIDCHDVHNQDTVRHQDLAETDICACCHQPGSQQLTESYTVGTRAKTHHAVCEY